MINTSNLEEEIYPVTIGNPNTVLYDESSTTTLSEEIEEIYCDNFINPHQSTVNIENSNDVVIGPVTQFHGPVTIYQNINGLEGINTKQLTDGAKDKKVEFKSDAKLINSKTTETSQQSVSNIIRKRYVIYGMAILLSICTILGTSLFIEANKSDKENTVTVPSVERPPNQSAALGQHRLIYREEWGGRPALNFTRPLKHPTDYVIISHTAGQFCDRPYECAPIMQSIQSWHVNHFQSPDIGYNFLIGGDGNIYVGRGWDLINFQDDNTIGISFMGNYIIYDHLTPEMIDAALKLIEWGLKMKKLASNYKIVCHNQTYITESPGENVYKEVVKWPHYYPGSVKFD